LSHTKGRKQVEGVCGQGEVSRGWRRMYN